MAQESTTGVHPTNSGPGGVLVNSRPNRADRFPREFEDRVIPVTNDPLNVFWVGTVGFEAWEDRILVIEDEFRSGYECTVCGESGSVVCPSCGGNGHSVVVKNAKCSQCGGDGRVTCAECKGKGVLLAIPEVSERRPTTGKIVSIGPKVKELHREQVVLYPDFVGHVMDLSSEDSAGRKHTCVLRVMRESEILCKITGGHLELRRMRRKVAVQDGVTA